MRIPITAAVVSLALASGALPFAAGARAQTLDDLRHDGRNTDDILTYGMGYGQNRYSPLRQIDKTNVSRLAPRWVFPLSNVTQVENTPIVVEGIMYVSSANEVYALDAGSGRQIWRYRRPRTAGLAGNAAIGFC